MREFCYQQRADGLLLFVKLTPNARADDVLGLLEGLDGPLISARVRAIADKGRANKALITLASNWLGVAKSCTSLKSGGKSRLKTLLIRGNAVELVLTLNEALATCAPQKRQQEQTVHE